MKKPIITIEDIQKRVTVKIEDVEIHADIDNQHIEITNEQNDNEFVFKSSATRRTIIKWKRVLKTLTILVKESEKVLKDKTK